MSLMQWFSENLFQRHIFKVRGKAFIIKGLRCKKMHLAGTLGISHVAAALMIVTETV